MSYIAGHYQMDLALAWTLLLEGKTDQENVEKKEYQGKANSKTPSISSFPRECYDLFLTITPNPDKPESKRF